MQGVSAATCRKLERGSDVFKSQLRVFRDDALGTKTLGDQPDDGRDGNARASDARHAAHEPVISHHAVGSHIEQGSRVSPW